MNAKLVGSFLGVASIAAIPLAALSISATAGAQGIAQRELFDWRGNVDQEVRVEMQGNRTSVIPMGPREMTGYDNARAMGGIPSVDGYVTVQMREGRGYADVVEQPSAQNGYTTVVRIRDTQGGVGSYDVAAFWQPIGGYGYGDNAQYGNYGDYGNYGAYGNYGGYGNGGVYRTYPQTVIVQQPVPVYRPVYGDRDRDAVGGKSLPVPERASEYPSRTQYPVQTDRSGDNGRYQNDGRYQSNNAQAGKALPSDRTAQPRQQDQQNRQSGKALPATTNGSSQNDGAWHRGH